MRKSAVFLIHLAGCVGAFSQKGNVIFNEITDKDVLKSVFNIYRILQGSKGFMWIGSADKIKSTS